MPDGNYYPEKPNDNFQTIFTSKDEQSDIQNFDYKFSETNRHSNPPISMTLRNGSTPYALDHYETNRQRYLSTTLKSPESIYSRRHSAPPKLEPSPSLLDSPKFERSPSVLSHVVYLPSPVQQYVNPNQQQKAKTNKNCCNCCSGSNKKKKTQNIENAIQPAPFIQRRSSAQVSFRSSQQNVNPNQQTAKPKKPNPVGVVQHRPSAQLKLRLFSQPSKTVSSRSSQQNVNPNQQTAKPKKKSGCCSGSKKKRKTQNIIQPNHEPSIQRSHSSQIFPYEYHNQPSIEVIPDQQHNDEPKKRKSSCSPSSRKKEKPKGNKTSHKICQYFQTAPQPHLQSTPSNPPNPEISIQRSPSLSALNPEAFIQRSPSAQSASIPSQEKPKKNSGCCSGSKKRKKPQNVIQPNPEPTIQRSPSAQTFPYQYHNQPSTEILTSPVQQQHNEPKKRKSSCCPSSNKKEKTKGKNQFLEPVPQPYIQSPPLIPKATSPSQQNGEPKKRKSSCCPSSSKKEKTIGNKPSSRLCQYFQTVPQRHQQSTPSNPPNPEIAVQRSPSSSAPVQDTNFLTVPIEKSSQPSPEIISQKSVSSSQGNLVQKKKNSYGCCGKKKQKKIRSKPVMDQRSPSRQFSKSPSQEFIGQPLIPLSVTLSRKGTSEVDFIPTPSLLVTKEHIDHQMNAETLVPSDSKYTQFIDTPQPRYSREELEDMLRHFTDDHPNIKKTDTIDSLPIPSIAETDESHEREGRPYPYKYSSDKPNSIIESQNLSYPDNVINSDGKLWSRGTKPYNTDQLGYFEDDSILPQLNSRLMRKKSSDHEGFPSDSEYTVPLRLQKRTSSFEIEEVDDWMMPADNKVGRDESIKLEVYDDPSQKSCQRLSSDKIGSKNSMYKLMPDESEQHVVISRSKSVPSAPPIKNYVLQRQSLPPDVWNQISDTKPMMLSLPPDDVQPSSSLHETLQPAVTKKKTFSINQQKLLRAPEQFQSPSLCEETFAQSILKSTSLSEVIHLPTNPKSTLPSQPAPLDAKLKSNSLLEVKPADSEQKSHSLSELKPVETKPTSHSLSELKPVESELKSSSLLEVKPVDSKQKSHSLSEIKPVEKFLKSPSLLSVKPALCELNSVPSILKSPSLSHQAHVRTTITLPSPHERTYGHPKFKSPPPSPQTKPRSLSPFQQTHPSPFQKTPDRSKLKTTFPNKQVYLPLQPIRQKSPQPSVSFQKVKRPEPNEGYTPLPTVPSAIITKRLADLKQTQHYSEKYASLLRSSPRIPIKIKTKTKPTLVLPSIYLAHHEKLQL